MKMLKIENTYLKKRCKIIFSAVITTYCHTKIAFQSVVWVMEICFVALYTYESTNIPFFCGVLSSQIDKNVSHSYQSILILLHAHFDFGLINLFKIN